MAANFSDPNYRGTTFPTFLDNDPYPTSQDGRPLSASSTNTSEFIASQSREDIPSSTGPVGEPPPSRPTSGVTSNDPSYGRGGSRASWASPPMTPSSRRGFTAFHPKREDMGSRQSSRPGSAVGSTHVPSLISQGFSRPMSPQMLQAQRGQTIMNRTGSASGLRQNAFHQAQNSVAEEQEIPDRRHRYSNASVKTQQETEQPTRDGTASPPPLPASRGFSITSSSNGHGLQSAAGPGSVTTNNSIVPLNTRLQQDQQKAVPPTPKSPLSFRASLGLNSRHSSRRDTHDRKPSRSHEKLHSNPSSPLNTTNEKSMSNMAGNTKGTGNYAGKNYEYFAGNMLFFLSGRCLNTKAQPLNIATFILTVLPAALFFAFSAPWLWMNLSPAIPIVFAYVFFVTMSSFLHAAFSDPGILPRNLHPHPPNADEDKDPLTVGPPTTEWVLVKTFPGRKKPSPQADAENGSVNQGSTAMEVPTKYCKSCNIWRPPRAHHCRTCDACIESQDHHCVWLNNCVGRRNYRFFFGFVGFASLMAFLLLAFSLVHIGYYAQQNDLSFGTALGGRIQERIAFAMFIYSILALPYPGSLFVYHLFLVGRGETTREYLNSHKFLPKDRHRPFSQASLLRNWMAVLFRPRSPSYMSFKRPYQEGDTRLGYTMTKQQRIEKAKEDSKRYSIQGAEKKAPQPDSGIEMSKLSSRGLSTREGDGSTTV
ncbi:Palmitoyltransferase erf2 [Fulvia fulva]|nr:Palmitoyltransferase erf2 [Fulvia fulva]KAK4609661.1 Palmitoyltransferase erf2 [Fulvia fulva]WPV37795.1 Palmitoyltransferase erf2 [Fulvia fulva]